MGDRQQPTRLQSRIGILVLVMAMAIALAPLGLAVAMHREGAPATTLLLVATLLWLLSIIIYRSLSHTHERWRRKMLRREVATARKARLDSSDAFQDHLHEQSAILDRIASISDSVLSAGITDPATVLANIRLINAHAHEAQGLVDDAIAEIRVETGSQMFNLESVDVRTEIEHIAAPFVRGDRAVTTSGAQHYAYTDAAVFRLMIRGLVSRAIELAADEIDIAVARDDALVVCTVADDGPDRSRVGTGDLPPLATSLAAAVDGEFSFSRTFGWNQYSISLPVGIAPAPTREPGPPMDVLGTRRPSQPNRHEPVPEQARTVDLSEDVAFPGVGERDRAQTVAARRKAPLAAR